LITLQESGTPIQWNDFSIKFEDGVEPTANQNNILKMTYDGLELEVAIAEGDYSDSAALAAAVQTALVTAIDAAVDALSEDALKAKGYKGLRTFYERCL
jgi:hypothetical protein